MTRWPSSLRIGAVCIRPDSNMMVAWVPVFRYLSLY